MLDSLPLGIILNQDLIGSSTIIICVLQSVKLIAFQAINRVKKSLSLQMVHLWVTRTPICSTLFLTKITLIKFQVDNKLVNLILPEAQFKKLE